MRTNIYMSAFVTVLILLLNFFFYVGTKSALTSFEVLLLFPATFGIYTLYDGIVAHFKNAVVEAVKEEDSRVDLKK